MFGRKPGRPRSEGLTPAEERVLAHVRDGLTNAEIAVRLGVSVNTVRYHVTNLLAKAEVADRRQLAAWQPGRQRRQSQVLPVAGLALAAVGATAALAVGIGVAWQLLVDDERSGEGSAEVADSGSDASFQPPVASPTPEVRQYAHPAGVAAPPLFLVTWAAGTTPPGGLLRPIDPATGADRPGFEAIDIVQAVIGVVSPSGTKMLASNALSGSAPGWAFQAVDLATWSATPLGQGLYGADSAWLPGETGLIQSRSAGPAGRSIWRVDSGTAAETLIAKLEFTIGSNFALSPAGDALYAVGFDTKDGYVSEADAFVAAVDLRDGTVRRIEIPGLKAGQYHETIDGIEMWTGYRPAIALSPGGETLYLAHAESEALTAIDTATGQVVGTTSVSREPSRFERFGAWVAGFFADTAEAKGGPSTSRDLRITPDGAHLVVGGWISERCPEVECMTGTADLRVIETATLREVLRVPRAGRFALSADGTVAVAVGTWQGPPVVGDWLTLSGNGLTVVDLDTLTATAVPGARLRYGQVVASPDGVHAFALSNEPGEAAVRDSGQSCQQRCFALATVDLRTGEIVSERPLEAAWAQLIGPE